LTEITSKPDGKNTARNYTKKNENLLMPNTNWQFTNEPSPLLEEIKEAIKDLKIGKSPGNDQVTAEMIKYGGEKVAIFYHRLCTKSWKRTYGQMSGENQFLFQYQRKGTFYNAVIIEQFRLLVTAAKSS